MKARTNMYDHGAMSNGLSQGSGSSPGLPLAGPAQDWVRGGKGSDANRPPRVFMSLLSLAKAADNQCNLRNQGIQPGIWCPRPQSWGELRV